MNQGNHEQSIAWRQSKALLGIRESVQNYAFLYNYYIKIDRWDKADTMMHIIDNLGYVIPFIAKSLKLDVSLDIDGNGKSIKEIVITCNGDVIGLPWVLNGEVMK